VKGKPQPTTAFTATKATAGRPRTRDAALPDLATLEKAPLYSEELGLDLASGRERDLFLWFLASLLFGQRISETIARHTFESFLRHRLDSPEKIIAAGWDYLVNPVMHEGGYVRYDESKSRKLLRDCRTLLDEYGGSLARLHAMARDARDLEARLDAFYGVGPVTANIFLRELRPFWTKADPVPLPVVRNLARRAGIDLDHLDRKSLRFARVEAGLVRLRHRMRRRVMGP
jgi:endonuclease III